MGDERGAAASRTENQNHQSAMRASATGPRSSLSLTECSPSWHRLRLYDFTNDKTTPDPFSFHAHAFACHSFLREKRVRRPESVRLKMEEVGVNLNKSPISSTPSSSKTVQRLVGGIRYRKFVPVQHILSLDQAVTNHQSQFLNVLGNVIAEVRHQVGLLSSTCSSRHRQARPARKRGKRHPG